MTERFFNGVHTGSLFCGWVKFSRFGLCRQAVFVEVRQFVLNNEELEIRNCELRREKFSWVGARKAFSAMWGSFTQGEL